MRFQDDGIRGITFYKQLFLDSNKLSWPQVCQVAKKFTPLLLGKWTDLYSEISGVAAGSGQSSSSILALNVRTEIAFGMFSDGCTALSWKYGNTSLLAQNWDWQQEQKENLIRLRIEQNGKPNIDMVTEAGIIGKIGLNSAGVGVCLNAIRAKGVDFGKLPCHLALRRCLDSNSRAEAVAALQSAGVASSCHILVADLEGGTGVECSSDDMVLLPMSDNGLVLHTNHFVKDHFEVEEKVQFEDSNARLVRTSEITNTAQPGIELIQRLLDDEDGYPVSINRQRTKDSTITTLFSVIMNLNKRCADVRLGRPTTAEQEFKLQPDLKELEAAGVS
ncbi:MAG: hypothetical protein Q9213_004288 [Squamulea squamosa]